MERQLDRMLERSGVVQSVAVLRGEPGEARAGEVLRHFLDRVPETVGGRAAELLGEEESPALVRPAARCFPTLGVVVGYVDRECADCLEREVAVEALQPAESLALVRPVAVRRVAHRARWTWGLRRLGIPALRAAGLTGAGVRVGHVDSGLDASHPALAGRLAAFAEFDDQGRKVPASSPHDSGDHGTHTAGTLCGGPVTGREIGVAPGVELYSALVLRGDDAQQLPVLAGLEWMIAKGVRIVNLSIGFRGFTPFFEAVTRALRRRGILPIFAIGNEGVGTSRSPGNYPEALSVGASDPANQVPAFSSSIVLERPVEPQQPNVVAPGASVISAAAGGGGVVSMDGTSMAAPHVAGVAALLLEAHPTATADEVERALQSTCRSLDGVPAARFGHGLLSPQAALGAL